MSLIIDLINSHSTIDKFMCWVAKSRIKRLIFSLLVGTLILGSYYYATQSLLSKEWNESEMVEKNANLDNLENSYQSIIDWTKLCMSSRQEKFKNADWYCKNAIDLFKSDPTKFAPGIQENAIKKKAYGAIIAYTTAQLRALKIKRLYALEPKNAQKLLHEILDKTGLVITGCIVFLLMFSNELLLAWYARRGAVSSVDETEESIPNK